MFSERDIWAFEFAKRQEAKNLKVDLEEYHSLLDILLYLNETLTEAKALLPYWQTFSSTLRLKFCFHGLSIHQLLSGTTLKSTFYNKEVSGKRILDFSSVKVLLRAQMETFLMYNHIYINPNNDEDKLLRHYAWIYSSLLQRKKFPTLDQQGEIWLQQDQDSIDILRAKIEKLDSFKRLSDKQQVALLKGGSSKLFHHWSKIFEDCGFGERHAFNVYYGLLCDFSHAEGLSALQLHESFLQGNENIASTDLSLSKMLISIMIETLIKQFKIVAIKFNVLPKNQQFLVEYYAEIGRRITF